MRQGKANAILTPNLDVLLFLEFSIRFIRGAGHNHKLSGKGRREVVFEIPDKLTPSTWVVFCRQNWVGALLSKDFPTFVVGSQRMS